VLIEAIEPLRRGLAADARVHELDVEIGVPQPEVDLDEARIRARGGDAVAEERHAVALLDRRVGRRRLREERHQRRGRERTRHGAAPHPSRGFFSSRRANSTSSACTNRSPTYAFIFGPRCTPSGSDQPSFIHFGIAAPPSDAY